MTPYYEHGGIQIFHGAYWAFDEFVRVAREVLALPGAEEMGLEREDEG